MNQGIAFSRTFRALDADDFRASKFGLFVAALVLAAWAWWMFGASVPEYESTTNVQIESGQVVAYFPPDALRFLKVNQSAILHFDGRAFDARVGTVAPDHAVLVLAANRQSPTANARAAASADIEISRVSPASFALKTLGRAR
jgi:hypothetical protein